MGQDEILILDGSRSSDPDGTSDAVKYAWTCFDADRIPCFEPDPNSGGLKRMVIPSVRKATVNVATQLKANTK